MLKYLIFSIIFSIIVSLNAPISISQSNSKESELYYEKNVFVTYEEILVIKDDGVDYYVLRLLENKGSNSINIIHNNIYCFSNNVTKNVYVKDALNKNKGVEYKILDDKHCFILNEWEDLLKAGDSYWYEILFEMSREYFVIKQDNLWAFQNGFQLSGPFNIARVKIKLPHTPPFYEPMLENVLPSPDFIYDELQHKVFVWNLPLKDIKKDDRIVSYIQFKYKYIPDWDRIKWDFFILGIGFGLGFLTTKFRSFGKKPNNSKDNKLN